MNVAALLETVNHDVAVTYFELSARWLAAMHRLGLRVSPLEATARRERRRFQSYRRSFRETGSPHLKLADRMIQHVADREEH